MLLIIVEPTTDGANTQKEEVPNNKKPERHPKPQPAAQNPIPRLAKPQARTIQQCHSGMLTPLNADGQLEAEIIHHTAVGATRQPAQGRSARRRLQADATAVGGSSGAGQPQPPSRAPARQPA